MIITPSTLSALFTAYDTRFSQAYASYQPKPWYTNFSMMMPSKTATNVYAWLARLPRMKEWLGSRTIVNLSTRSYTLPNRKFELTVGIPRTTIEDDQYDTYGTWMDLAAYEAAKWPDTVVAPLLISGSSASTAQNPCFDGQNFFSTSHPIDPSGLVSGVQSNYYSSGKALSFDNYATVRANMRAIVGEDSNPLGIEPNLLVVPPQLEAIAKTIVENKLMAPGTISGQTMVGGQDNPYAGTAKVLMLPELSVAPTVWYLMDTTKPVKPIIWQLRQAPETVYRNQLTDEHVFNADEFLYGVRARGNAGFGLWQLAAQAQA